MFSCLTLANTKSFSSFTSEITSVLALLYLFSVVSFAISFSLICEFPTSFACYKRQAYTLIYVPLCCIKMFSFPQPETAPGHFDDFVFSLLN